MRHQHQGAIGRHRYRSKIFDRIERRVFVELRRNQHGVGAHQQGAAIGSRFRNKVCADVAAGTRHVLHQHSLPRPLRQARLNRAGYGVHACAGRERHDDFDGCAARSGGLCKTCNANKRRQYRRAYFLLKLKPHRALKQSSRSNLANRRCAFQSRLHEQQGPRSLVCLSK